MKKLIIIIVSALITTMGVSQTPDYYWPLDEWSTLPGVDLVTNGTFTGSADDWTLGAGWAYGTYNVSFSGGSAGILAQTCMEIGKRYIIAVTASNITGTVVFISASFSEGVDARYITNGSKNYTLTAASTSFGIYCGAGATGTIDNVVIRELNTRSLEVQHGFMGTGSNIHNSTDHRGSGLRHYSFDGVDDYVNLGTSTSLDIGTGDASFEFNVKRSAISAGSTEYLYDNYDAGTGDRTSVWISTNNTIGARIQENATEKYVQATNTISDLLDHVVTFTLDRDVATGLKLFIDGNECSYSTQQDPSTIAGSIASTANKYIGTAYSVVAFSYFELNSIRFYNYAVSADSIASYSTAIAKNTFLLPGADKGATNAALYTSDFTSDDGFAPTGGTIANSVTKDGEVNCLEFTLSGGNVSHWAQKTISWESGKKYRLTGKVWIPSGVFSSVQFRAGDPTNVFQTVTTKDTWVDIDTISTNAINGETVLRIAATGDFDGNKFWVKDIIITELGSTLSLSPEGMTPNIWIDYDHSTTGTVSGASLVVSSSSNLGATYFNGIDSKITLAEDLVIDTNNSTFSWWQIRDDLTLPALASFGLNASGTESFLYFTSGSLKIETDTNEDFAVCTISPNDANWHFYTITFNNKTVQIYQDGIAQLMGDAVVTDDTITFDQIGVRGTILYFFSGAIADVWYIPQYKSASEVLEMYGRYKN